MQRQAHVTDYHSDGQFLLNSDQQRTLRLKVVELLHTLLDARVEDLIALLSSIY